MDDFYCAPITKEYTTRGCDVRIDAVTDPDRVTVTVKNNKSGKGSIYSHILLPNSDNGYSNKDMTIIKTELDKLLDEYGENECEKLHFTNQILS